MGMNSDEIEDKALSSLIRIFYDIIEYLVFNHENVENAIEATNREAYNDGLDCYIEHLHLDMNGMIEIFVRGITNPSQVEIISDNACGLPPGHQDDFYGISPVQPNTSNNPMHEVYIDIFPDIPSPEENAYKVEQKVTDYITENYDKYSIKENGPYMYDIIQQKISDFAIEVAHEIFDGLVGFIDYHEDEYVEKLMDNVSMDSFYELLDNIEHATMTQEEKLAEVGMSVKDFL